MPNMRILYVSTVASTLIMFLGKHIRMLQEQGHVVEFACNMAEPRSERLEAMGGRIHSIPFSRSPFSKDNLAAYRALKKLLNENHYDIVHTHTPNASAIVRLACRKYRKQGLRVFYTAHGFHFYTGAPRKNWLLYYPVERFLSRWTDVLITMNLEDYDRARTFRAGRVEYMHGVGVDIRRFDLDWTEERCREKRRELGLEDGDRMLLSVGELSRRKNHETVIRALAKAGDPTLHYYICGAGPLKDSLDLLAKELGIAGQVHLLGTRRDIPELDRAADLFLFPSYQEGLPVALMEAMASGLPVICSGIRGNRDLIAPEEGGILCPPADVEQWAGAIRRLLGSPELRRHMGIHNRQAVRTFDTAPVLEELRKIYGLEGRSHGEQDQGPAADPAAVGP